MKKRVPPAAAFAAGRRPAAGARAALCCAVALLAMADAAALSLGRMQGTPLIGRALQVTVPVTLQPDEDLSCVRAELQQPEIAPIPLSWRLDRTEGGGLLRLSSTAVVQEPIVTVKLVVGCNDQFTQGYVLLADPPPLRESVPLVVAAPPPAAAPASPAPAPRSTGRAAPTTTTTPEGFRLETTLPARPAVAAPAPAPVTAPAPTQEARPAARRSARTAAKAPPAKPPVAPGRPRLQVDLLDIAIDQAPALKVSTQLAQPAAGAMTRTEAAAAWQQINSPPEQQLAAKEPSEAIQAELKALREQTRRQAELLQQMQEERNLARDLLAALAGAIALGLGVLLWRRSRDTGGGRPWWQKERAETGPVAAPADSSFVDSSVPEEDPPVRVAPEPDSGWAVPASSRTAAAGAKGADSGYGRSRLPSAEELLDVQEKANFFLAIGQPEKAIELLESRLLEHLGSSPFLWLDLLDLCRRLGRAADYERVRKEFQKVFAARMPPFEEAEPNTEGLEHYPKALSRIELLWPSSKVLKEIEKSLFQDPAPGSIMFDLEASRDLLLLYSVALEVVTSREDGTPYDRTQVAALEGEAPHTTEPVPLMALDSEAAPEDESVDLDLDFSMLDTASAAVAAAAAQSQVADPPTAADEPPAAPHEIEWETPELPAVAPEPPAATSEPVPPDEAPHEPMLPELDLGNFQPRAAAEAAPVVAESSEEGVLAPLQLDELNVDALQLADDEPPQPAAVADNGLDFNLDLDPAESGRTQVK